MTRQEVEELVKNQIGESYTLEFKRADALYNLATKTEEAINDFTKDVTAMANSSGGTLIYGIQEFPKGNKKSKAKKLSPISKDRISVEWMEQIMNTRIQPRIQNYRIHVIDLNENEFILVFVFKESITVHQANDKRYYRRFEFQSVRMDDWEIKALVNRQNKPILQEKIFIQKKQDFLIRPLNRLRVYDYQLVIAVENIGNIMANFLNCHIRFENAALHHMNPANIQRTQFTDYFDMFFTNRISHSINIGNNSYEVGSEYEPILANSWRQLELIPITKNFFLKKTKVTLFISTESNHLTKNYFTTDLEVIDN